MTTATSDDGLTYTLPSWIYNNDEYFELEKEHVLMPAWHVVCHESDIPEVGDYSTFDLLGERAFVIRGKDRALRAFHNVCAHRAHAVVMGTSGNCKSTIQCSLSRLELQSRWQPEGACRPGKFCAPHTKRTFWFDAPRHGNMDGLCVHPVPVRRPERCATLCPVCKKRSLIIVCRT